VAAKGYDFTLGRNPGRSDEVTGRTLARSSEGTRHRALRTANLRVQMADSLRGRLSDGEWAVGEQLPTEAELASEYSVSRSTVRSALQQLATQGLTITRHGIGTFVSPYGNAIETGLQELRSMTATIQAHGMTPRMDYHSVQFRDVEEDEAVALAREPGTPVLATSRAVTADDEVVAFSYETIPADVLPAGLQECDVHGSLFALMDDAGVVPQTAVAEVHAASGPEIGWGKRDQDQLYVYLRQIHYDPGARPVVLSRTYFHEGRFQFSVLRIR